MGHCIPAWATTAKLHLKKKKKKKNPLNFPQRDHYDLKEKRELNDSQMQIGSSEDLVFSPMILYLIELEMRHSLDLNTLHRVVDRTFR